MRAVLETTDLVRLSWAQALLQAAGIEAVVLDEHASILQGSILAIPRRLTVGDDDAARARRLLAAADPAGPGGDDFNLVSFRRISNLSHLRGAGRAGAGPALACDSAPLDASPGSPILVP